MPKQRQNMHINSNSNGQETMNFSMKNASLASIGGIKNPSNPDVETKIVSSDGTHYVSSINSFYLRIILLS